MSGRKLAFLLLVLAFGGAVEIAYGVREHLEIGPAGCRVLSGRFYGPSFTFEDPETRVAVSAPPRLEVENAFGKVEVRVGEAGAVVVGLRKVVYLPTEEQARGFAERIRLETESEGNAVQVRTNRRSLTLGRDVGFETHLTVQVPPGSSLRVDNDHGTVSAVGLAAVSIRGSFDPVSVENAGGDVDIVARHGDVRVSSVEGALRVEAEHGDVEIGGVKGAADLSVQHGSVRVSDLGSLVLMLEHGDVEGRSIGGSVEVKASHAAVTMNGVGGAAELSTSYGRIRAQAVKGDLTCRTSHGNIQVTDAGGSVSARTDFDDVSLASVAGPAEVQVEHGAVRARSVSGGLHVVASGDEVNLDDFEGPVTVEARRAEVRLRPRGPLLQPLEAAVHLGSLRLLVPPGSQFTLEAAAERGDLAVSVPGLHVEESSPTRLRARLGQDGTTVKLRTDHGGLTVEAAPPPESSSR